jgi:hypothetical protein
MDDRMLPGGDLVRGGIEDLNAGIESPQALLVAIGSEGLVTFYYYDFYAQALAKIERGHNQDLQDVRAMIDQGLIDPHTVRRHFHEIEPRLYRYPAIHPPSFRQAVDDLLGERQEG